MFHLSFYGALFRQNWVFLLWFSFTLTYYCYTHNTADQVCGHFSYTKQLYDTSWLSHNLTQFHIDSVRSHRVRLSPMRMVLFYFPFISGVPQVPTTSVWLDYRLEVPMAFSPLDLIICQDSSQNLRKCPPTFTSSLKDMVKDTDEQPDKELHRARSGRIESIWASVPKELGYITLLAQGCVH